MPKSTTRTPAGSCRVASRRATSTPKPSSPRKMLPTQAISVPAERGATSARSSGSGPGPAPIWMTITAASNASTPRIRRRIKSPFRIRGFPGVGVQRLDLVGVEVEKPPMRAMQVACRVPFEAHRHPGHVLDVAIDPLDPCHAAGEEQVHGVGAPGGAQPDARALRQQHPADLDRRLLRGRHAGRIEERLPLGQLGERLRGPRRISVRRRLQRADGAVQALEQLGRAWRRSAR